MRKYLVDHFMNRLGLRYFEITGKIIGCAMRVHNYFGPGYQEIIYHRSLMLEFKKDGINARSEVEEVVTYYNEVVGKRRIDIVVEDKILIELKAISEIDSDCDNQILNCLKVFGFEVGLLFNFGKKRLQYKRFVRSKHEEE